MAAPIIATQKLTHTAAEVDEAVDAVKEAKDAAATAQSTANTNAAAITTLGTKVSTNTAAIASLGTISTHNIYKVSGKTPSSVGGEVVFPFPKGITRDSCIVFGYKVRSGTQYACNGFSDRIQICLTVDGVYVYVNHSSVLGKDISVYLYS